MSEEIIITGEFDYDNCLIIQEEVHNFIDILAEEYLNQISNDEVEK